MTVAEATQLLKSTTGDQIKMEILPVRLVEQKASKENLYQNNPGMLSANFSVISIKQREIEPWAFQYCAIASIMLV